MRRCSLFCVALFLVVCRSGHSQDVVSASAGVLQYFEGAVTLDGNRVEHKAAVFPSLKNGSVLHTERGRAELLLTPGVYLRLDENTSLHMLSNSLADTRLELTDGAVILDGLNANSSNPSVLLFHGSEIHFAKPGIYRVDSDVDELQVYTGEAKVTHQKITSSVDPSHLYYFALETTTPKVGDGATDEFYDWAHNRSELIADQNQIASADQDDTDPPDPGTAASGVFVAPPLNSSPSCAAPLTTPLGGYSLYATAVDPFYVYPRPELLGYPAFVSIVAFPPYRQRLGWPASGVAFHPRPGRWPTIGGSSFTSTSGSIIHYPALGTYRPPVTISRPSVTVIPHPAPSAVIARPAPVHIGGIGRR